MKNYFLLLIIVLLFSTASAFTAKHSLDSEVLLKEIGEEFSKGTLRNIENNINSISNELGENSINQMLKTGEHQFRKNMLTSWSFEGQKGLAGITNKLDSTTVNRALTQYGEDTIKQGSEFTGTYGDNVLQKVNSASDFIPLKQGKTVVDELNLILTNPEAGGLTTLLQKFPEQQADAVLVSMGKSGTWTDNAVKQSFELNPNGTLKNFEDEVILPSGQSADGLFTLNNQEYFVESTGITNKLGSTGPIVDSLETKSVKFLGSNSDNTIIIKLNKGSDVPNEIIENQILYEYTSHPERMNVIDRVHVYNAINNEVITILRPA